MDLVVAVSEVGKTPSRTVKLGTDAYWAHEGDQAALGARLPEPYYYYLISFRPDGRMELCPPSRDNEQPSATSSVSSPLGRAIDLNNGTGLQAFALVASHAPLPAYRAWRAEQGPPPWRGGIEADPEWSGTTTARNSTS